MRGKVIFRFALLIALVVSFNLGCGRGTDSVNKLPEQEKTEVQVESKVGKKVVTKKIDDDLYVEFAAQSAYISTKYAGDPVKTSEELKNLMTKLGVDGDDIEVYAETLNVAKAKELTERIAKRVQELQEGK